MTDTEKEIREILRIEEMRADAEHIQNVRPRSPADESLRNVVGNKLLEAADALEAVIPRILAMVERGRGGDALETKQFERKIVTILENHDMRRWGRGVRADGTFAYLQCYCGMKFTEDSNETMFRHVATKCAAEQAYEKAKGAEEEIEDGFGSVWGAHCPECGCKSMYVCRPGDARCSHCYDGNDCPNNEKAKGEADAE